MLNMYTNNYCTFKLYKAKIDRSNMLRYVQRDNAYNMGTSIIFPASKISELSSHQKNSGYVFLRREEQTSILNY